MKPTKRRVRGLTVKGATSSSKRKKRLVIPQFGTIFQGSPSAQGNSNPAQNYEIVPMPTHAGEVPHAPPLPTLRGLSSFKRSVSRTAHIGVKQTVQCKRYRKPSEKKKSSVYRGVTKCSEKRFESFVWDNDFRMNGKGGKTVYIGGFKSEIEAARAHDLISLRIWGISTSTNFPFYCYLDEIPEMQNMTKKECIYAIRRASQIASMLESLEINGVRNEEGTVPMPPQEQTNEEGTVPMPPQEQTNEEGTVAPMPPQEQTVDGAVSNIISNEAFDPNEHSNVELHNYHGELLEQHVTPSTLLVEQQNLDGFNIAATGATIEMEAGNITGNAFPNQGFITTDEQPMLLGIGQESQAPQAFQNQSQEPQAFQNQSQETANVNVFYNNQSSYDQYQGLAFQNGQSFQNDPNFTYSPYGFGTTPVRDNTRTLGNIFILDTSIDQMGKENPGGAGNGGGYSFGLDSVELHSTVPNNQDFGAPIPQVVQEQRNDQTFQYGTDTNTGSQVETEVESENDLDISQYLNLDHPEEEKEKEEENPYDWTDNLGELWAKMKADMLISGDLWFKEDGTPL